MSKSKIEANCFDCEGTGIYRSFREPEGVGVVCVTCKGTGKQIITYIPFTVRVRQEDIEFVRRSKGVFGNNSFKKGQVTYQEFLDGKMPSEN
ncbi:MAG: hypothetical protein Q8P20_02910 [bacterium]|nr:hypothetical protein [bacterium]